MSVNGKSRAAQKAARDNQRCGHNACCLDLAGAFQILFELVWVLRLFILLVIHFGLP
jgi:hypothetical protein